MKTLDTIIIGGGISGMACAKKLSENNVDFLLITKELGGRMLTSKTLTVDYGASYITTEYKNVLNYVEKGEVLSLWHIYFIQGNIIDTVFNFRNIFHLPRILKMAYLINDFTKRLSKFRQRSLIIGQKEALKEDEILTKYTRMSANDFIKENKIEYLDKTFFKPILESTVFSSSNDNNAAYYLAVLIPMVRKTYAADFRHTTNRLTHSFKDKIIFDTVTSVTKNSDGYFNIETKTEEYIAKNVVIAAPYTDAHKIYPIRKIGPSIPIYVIHIVGKREEIYQNKTTVFFNSDHHDITILWKQHTGSDIVFSKIPNPKLDKYYEYHHVVKVIHWRNALSLSGSVDNWTEQIIEPGLYLASDYNICGLEDSYLTGEYAANQIINQRD